ncbi:hypothetical protein IMCC26207_102140 [Actinobacteria bacterium IMCC26207]|nr:hypothetical protein IMCC26207_102140 [Actinobacteria bacterium IMCC26207]
MEDSSGADSRSAEGIEHVQRAAREMIKAARSFLDLVEEVVDDPDRITEAAASVADMVKGSFSKPEQPWERSAWSETETESESETETETETESETETKTKAESEAESDTHAESGSAPMKEPESPQPSKRTPPSSRVRRIAVDGAS